MTPSPRAARAPLSRLGAPQVAGSRLSRRGLLGAGVLAGVLAASGVPVGARVRGGVLRLAVAGPLPQGPEGWDTRADPLLGLAVGLVAETLTEIGPGGELLPGLAVAWEADGAARLWRLHLSREARFHDGTALRPEDVVASLALHRTGSPLAPLLAGAEDLRADGPHAVGLRLGAGDPDLPLRLASPRLAVWREGRPDGVGTGLYRLDPAALPGRLRAVRVDAHPRDGRAGFFEAVEVEGQADPARRRAALGAGEADAAALPEGPAGAGLAWAEPAEGPWAALRALAGEAGATPFPTLRGPALAHGPVSGLAALDGGRLPERWWMA